MQSPSTPTTLMTRYRRYAAGVLAAGVAMVTIGAVPSAVSARPLTATGSVPVANDDEYETLKDTTVEVPAPGVLANDVDPDGDPIGIWDWQRVTPAGGTVSIDIDGSFTYEPPSGFVGTDTWTYQIADGTGFDCDIWPGICLPSDPELDQATVTITVREEPSVGPPVDDPSPGTGEPDPDEDETPEPDTDEMPAPDESPQPDTGSLPEADGDDSDESIGPDGSTDPLNVTPRAPARPATPDYTG